MTEPAPPTPEQRDEMLVGIQRRVCNLRALYLDPMDRTTMSDEDKQIAEMADDIDALLTLAAQAQRDAEELAALREDAALRKGLTAAAHQLADLEIKRLDAALAVAEQEVARLREKMARHEKCAEEWQANELAMAERENELHDEKDARLAVAEQRGRQLEAALRYADHLETCVWWQATEHQRYQTACDCGFSAARAALSQPTDGAPTCWWDAPTACPRHGASVFLCPDAPEKPA